MINFDIDKDSERVSHDLFLLTSKPVLFVCNISEDDLNNPFGNSEVSNVKNYVDKQGSNLIVLCAKIEAEIAELEGEDKNIFLYELGIEESGLDKLLKIAYERLGLITFFT